MILGRSVFIYYDFFLFSIQGDEINSHPINVDARFQWHLTYTLLTNPGVSQLVQWFPNFSPTDPFDDFC